MNLGPAYLKELLESFATCRTISFRSLSTHNPHLQPDTSTAQNPKYNKLNLERRDVMLIFYCPGLTYMLLHEEKLIRCFVLLDV